MKKSNTALTCDIVNTGNALESVYPKHSHLWKKGQSGNTGNKKKLSLTKMLNTYLAYDDAKKAAELVEKTVANAMRGNGYALKEVWTRIDGPLPSQQIAQVSNITINFNELADMRQVIMQQPGGQVGSDNKLLIGNDSQVGGMIEDNSD